MKCAKIKNITIKILKVFFESVLLFAAIEIFYKLTNRLQGKWPVILSHIFGMLILAAIYWMLLGILKSTFVTNIVLSSFFFIILIICQIKIAYSLNPLFLSDINFLSSPGTFTDIMSGNVLKIIWKQLPFILLLAAMLVLICVHSKFRNIKINRPCFRITSFALPLIFLLFLFIPLKAKDDKIIDTFFKVDLSKNLHTSSSIKYYFMHSFVGGMYGEHLLSRLSEPDNYSKEKMEAILEEAAKLKSDKEWGRPNIIMIFSETFWDMENVREVTFDSDITPNFKRIAQNGMSFNMISPTFGGLSCNPEFMVLTGGSCSYFSQNYIPYINLYLNDNYYEAPSVISELKRNGYYTKLVSAWSKNLFNSENVYEYYGIDEVMFKNDLNEPVYKGKYISDDYVADCIINELKNKSDDKPLFYMFLTAEAHMPYYDDKFDEYDISVESSELNEEMTGMLKAFAQGIYDADKCLGKVYDFIKDYDEPTIIIFYGDHLPFLNTADGENVYSYLEYFSGMNGYSNPGMYGYNNCLYEYRLHNTKGLIAGNYDMNFEDIGYLGYDLIMPYVFSRIDIEVSPFYKWLNSTRDILPAFSYNVAADKYGNIYDMGNLPEEARKMSRLREQMNWYQFVDIPH